MIRSFLFPVFAVVALSSSSPPEAPKGAAAQEDAALLKLRDEALASAKCPDRKNPVQVKAPKAKYPTSLMKKKIQGQVVVEAIIPTDGRVTGARVMRSDHPDFSKETLRVLKEYRYKPATCSGVAVPTYITISQYFNVH